MFKKLFSAIKKLFTRKPKTVSQVSTPKVQPAASPVKIKVPTLSLESSKVANFFFSTFEVYFKEAQDYWSKLDSDSAEYITVFNTLAGQKEKAILLQNQISQLLPKQAFNLSMGMYWVRKTGPSYDYDDFIEPEAAALVKDERGPVYMLIYWLNQVQNKVAAAAINDYGTLGIPAPKRVTK